LFEKLKKEFLKSHPTWYKLKNVYKFVLITLAAIAIILTHLLKKQSKKESDEDRARREGN
jgi:hypothetical protein